MTQIVLDRASHAGRVTRLRGVQQLVVGVVKRAGKLRLAEQQIRNRPNLQPYRFDQFEQKWRAGRAVENR